MGHRLKAFLIILVAIFITLMPIFDVSARTKRLSFEMEARLRDAYWWRPNKNMCANKNSTTDGSNVTIIGDSITEITSAGHTVNGSKHPDNHNDTNDFEEYLPEAEIYAQWGKSFWDDNGNDGGEGGKVILDRLASENALREIVVYALGTNNSNSLNSDWIDYVVDTIGENHTIVFMTMTDGGNPMTNNNRLVESAANKYDNVVIADWAGAAGSDPDLYIDQNDTVHPSIHEGTKLFAETIYDAISCSETIDNPCDEFGTDLEDVVINGSNEGYERLKATVRTYGQLAMDMQRKYGVPWELVFAQMQNESGMGTAGIAVSGATNNWLGITGSGDAGYYESSNGRHWAKFSSVGASIEHWAGPHVLRNGYYDSAFVYLNPSSYNLHAFIVEMLHHYAPSSDGNNETAYAAKVEATIAGPIRAVADEKGWPSSAELATKENIAIGGQNPLNVGIAPSVPSSGSYVYCSETNTTERAELKSGGMTLSEAQQFMARYIEEAKKKRFGDFVWDNTSFTDQGCANGSLNNCSAFTTWFVNNYTSANGVQLHQGSGFVSYLTTNLSNSFTNNGKVPAVYSILSQGPRSGSADGWSNHTAIVLGIDASRNKMIIGEATCHEFSDGWLPRAREVDLDKYTNSSSPYGPTYAVPKTLIGL